MATIQKDRILQFRGQDLYDRDGDKIGSIEEIYLDAETERARVGARPHRPLRDEADLRPAPRRDGARRQPLRPVREEHGQGRPGHRRQRPALAARGGRAVPPLRAGLLRGRARTRRPARGAARRPTATDIDASTATRRAPSATSTSGPTTRRRDDALRGGAEASAPPSASPCRARLRKYVVHRGRRSRPIPVKREEVRDRAQSRSQDAQRRSRRPRAAQAISEEEHERIVTLPPGRGQVVRRRSAPVPKERVRMDKDVEVEEKTVKRDGRARGDQRSTTRVTSTHVTQLATAPKHTGDHIA